ncbi:MAG: carboxypeptidase Taq [Solirubrobacteraceae bacterium]|nr:carboxypeptidase Taq [Solirubrobacteraceae bacterium]
MSAAPAELGALRERMAELSDLGRIHSMLFWDQNTMMPPRGAAARADHSSTLELISHQRLTDPDVGRLLDALAPWAADEDPDSDDVRLLAAVRRDHEKAVRVPAALAAEMSHADALGQQAWQEARAASDFSRFRDALARHVELRHRYVACFEPAAHPYDILLDDFEPGLTTAELRPLFATLRDELVGLVAGATQNGEQARNNGAFSGPFEVDDQRRAVMAVLEAVGFDPDGWRLDPAPHPFAQSLGPSDVRITTRYDLHDFGVAHFSALHEFGHGLYEAGIATELARSPLGQPVSLGIHESQSRLWENLVGRSRPFCSWVLPSLREHLGHALGAIDAEALYRAVNTVQRSLIRVDADETTYNLHIILRFELELALIEGALEVDGLPAAWSEGMQRLLGVDVADDAQGVLQDVHWGAGLFGYFPTYTLGNLIAAQLWTRVLTDLPEIDAQIGRGDLAPLREWLRENIHRHGRKFPPRELLYRVTGEELRPEPFLDYLRAKLADVAA